MRTHVFFDNHDLSELFHVADVKRMEPVRTASVEQVPGGRGGVLTDSRHAPLEVSMRLTAYAGTRRERLEAIHTLMGWLDVDTPRRLQFSDDGGRYYEAVPSGGGEPSGGFHSDGVTVVFTVPDPVMFGAERSVEVPSGGSVTFSVGGNHPTTPTLACEDAGATSGLWGCRLVDTGERLVVPVASTGEVTVDIDCEGRECYVSGAYTLPTLDSDWWELAPGRHTVQMHQGTGTAVITWQERWL